MTSEAVETYKAELRRAREATVLRRGPDYMASPEQRLLNRIEAVKARAFIDSEDHTKDELAELHRRLNEVRVRGSGQGRSER